MPFPKALIGAQADFAIRAVGPIILPNPMPQTLTTTPPVVKDLAILAA